MPSGIYVISNNAVEANAINIDTIYFIVIISKENNSLYDKNLC